jgi:hypothetical protein
MAARAEVKEAAPRATALGPSRRTVYKLAALFSLDAFAGGFTVQSLMALWLFERFDLSLAAASAFFFWSNVLTAFSYPVAARLGKRFGLVNTMVFTHIPLEHLSHPCSFLAEPYDGAHAAARALCADARLRGTAVTLAAAVRSAGVTTAMTRSCFHFDTSSRRRRRR